MNARFNAFRAAGLTLANEFRLLRRDRVGLFMLLAAPIVVIAAAGFSLADVYAGGSRGQPDRVIALVDEDHGDVGRAVAAALEHQHGIRVIVSADRERARKLVLESRTALLAVIVPAGSTTAMVRGREALLLLVIDPVRYQQAVRVVAGLGEMCRQITASAASKAQADLVARRAALIVRINRIMAALRDVRARAAELQRAAAEVREDTEMRIRQQVAATIASVGTQREKAFEASLNEALSAVAENVNAQALREHDAQIRLKSYFAQLESVRADFERWFAQLKQLAGGNAQRIPAPPAFPDPPADLVALLTAPASPPIDAAALRGKLASKADLPAAPAIMLALPPSPKLPQLPSLGDLPPADLGGTPVLPGSLGLAEGPVDAKRGTSLRGFNAFDLQVPGFSVTFLLIGMLMGLSLALIDENEWGTLARLRSAAAPLSAMLIGKMAARFCIGLAQMIVLFVAGRLMFGMSLGRQPLALLVPAAAIAFAAAAFGLVVAGAGRTRDAVLPVGAIVIMTMAAMGGCWWPIDFEPAWMQTAALALPTTWAMRAFNDLMIRELPVSAALMPSAVNAGFGILYAAAGAAIARRRFA